MSYFKIFFFIISRLSKKNQLWIIYYSWIDRCLYVIFSNYIGNIILKVYMNVYKLLYIKL